jgi:hypothetical protein
MQNRFLDEAKMKIEAELLIGAEQNITRTEARRGQTIVIGPAYNQRLIKFQG